MGRFISADSLVPNPGSALDYDRYMYAAGNPLRFVDPSGHGYCDSEYALGEECAEQTIYELNVNLSSSIPYNEYKAQYHYMDNNPEMRRGLYNLCGHISMQMIYETVTGKYNALGDVYGIVPKSGGTSTSDLAKIFSALFPRGWRAVTYVSDSVIGYNAGNPNGHTTGPTGNIWHKYDEDYTYRFLASQLSQGHYIIASANLNLGNGYLYPGSDPMPNSNSDNIVPHWVVIESIQNGYVSINNPFCNRNETYSWSDFYAAFGYEILIFIPPSSPNNEYGYD